MSFFEQPSRKCRACGCSEFDACYDERLGGGCAWVEPDLCSNCGTQEQFDEWARAMAAGYRAHASTIDQVFNEIFGESA